MQMQRECKEANKLKTVKVSDEIHRELTRLLGEMIAQNQKSHTYNDVVKALITRSSVSPADRSGK